MILVKNEDGMFRNIANMDVFEDSMIGGKHVFARRYHPRAIETITLFDVDMLSLSRQIRQINRGESEPVIFCDWDENWTEIGRPVSRAMDAAPECAEVEPAA